MRTVLLVIMAIAMLSTFTVQAKLYKWVDENGQTHFGDRIPVQYQKKEHQELNERGVTMKTQEAMKTPEELAEARRIEKERKQAMLEEKKKKQRDRVLLDTYTTERDLVVARDSRLEAIDSQIQLAESIIMDSNAKIEGLEKKVTQIKASNREVPQDLFDRIENQKQQIEVQSHVKSTHVKRRQEISEQFNGYIKRFNILKAEQKAKRKKLMEQRAGG